jgi:Zn-dependent alcohol dehydrogenase
MRAVVLRDGRLDVREIADPVPGPGELLLRTLSTAICASDVHFIDHPEMGVNDPTGRSLYDANRDIVLGHEFVGEVVGHGTGCTAQFPVGARVTSIPIRLVNGGADGARIIGQHPDAQGSFGELLVVAEALAKPVDGDISSDAVALTDAFAVGEFYVRAARMEPGEMPLVIGAGAIGLSAVVALGRPRRRADHRVGLQIGTPRTGSRQLRGAHRGRSGGKVSVRRVARAACRARALGPVGGLRMCRRRRPDPADRPVRRHGHADLLRRWVVHR